MHPEAKELDARSPEATSARRWLGLAVGSLVLAGLLSLLLVIGRMPPFDALISDPLFFRRCLVVHVDFALVVWFYAFIAGLLSALARPGTSSRISRVAPFISAFGVLLMLLGAGGRGAQPVLANYIAMIDDRAFEAGLVTFGVGVVAGFLDSRLLPATTPPTGAYFPLPDAAEPGLRAAAIAILLASLTFAASWLGAPTGLTSETLFELATWGGGHVLQLASAAALLSVWLVLVGGVLGRSPVSRPVASSLFAALILPWLAAPLLAAKGIQDIGARDGFTLLMRWAIFPVIVVFLGLILRSLWRAKQAGELAGDKMRDPRLLGFAVSASLTVLGFVLGALIRGSNTIVPAHYHASIGAVTAAFMTVTYPLLAHLGYPLVRPRLARVARLQPLVYGLGQMVFASGFALAGSHGMARKVYGSEQHGRDFAETAGLVIMGLGGLVAVVAGLSFLYIVITAWRDGRSTHRAATGSLTGARA